METRSSSSLYVPTRGAPSIALLLLLIFSTERTTANLFCEDGCVVPFEGKSCPEVLQMYWFQGDCCSLSSDPTTNDCILTVATGSCYYSLPITGEDECMEYPAGTLFPPPTSTQQPELNLSLPALQARQSLMDMFTAIVEEVLPEEVTDAIENFTTAFWNDTDMPDEFNDMWFQNNFSSMVNETIGSVLGMGVPPNPITNSNFTTNSFNMPNFTTPELHIPSEWTDAMNDITSSLWNHTNNDTSNNDDFIEDIIREFTAMVNQTIGNALLSTNNNFTFPTLALPEVFLQNLDSLANATCFHADGYQFYIHVSLLSTDDETVQCPVSEFEIPLLPPPFGDDVIHSGSSGEAPNNTSKGQEEESLEDEEEEDEEEIDIQEQTATRDIVTSSAVFSKTIRTSTIVFAILSWLS